MHQVHHIELPTISQALKPSIAFLWVTSWTWPIALISEWISFFNNLKVPSQISSSVCRLTYSVDKEGEGRPANYQGLPPHANTTDPSIGTLDWGSRKLIRR